ncbi:MAG: PAS domain-containing protein [Acidobacteria bacterium]|nr:PAS domain-containing protein [Acidobacteriota bacterium]
MSLRARLLLLITGTVALVVFFLSALQLDRLVTTLLAHASERAATTAQLVKTQVVMRTQELPESLRPRDGSLEDLKLAWRRALEADQEFSDLLASTLAQTRSVVEISVADEFGLVVASSNPGRKGKLQEPKLTLAYLERLGLFDRLSVILGGRQDYEQRVALGVPGQPRPIFTVQVLVSSVLLRDAVWPDVRRAAIVAVSALLVSLLTALTAAHLVLRPLRQISRTIDRIASGGESAEKAREASSTREFRVVQQKLQLLGAQYRDTQEGATQLRGGVEKLMERIEEAILLFDAGGRALISTPAAERLLGISRDEVLTRRLADLFPEGTMAGDAVAQAILSRQPLRNVSVEWPRDGTAAKILFSLEPLPNSVLLRLYDPEGRRAVEAQLNLSSRLTSINRLTGGVAHAIKNPLNSIALRLELLRSRVLPEVPEARGEIEIIAQEISRLDKVVRTFLDFTRPVELNAVSFDLAETAAGLVDLVRPEAERRGVRVETQLPDSPVRVCGDKELLRQALLNIFRNALDAMPEGGRLGVEAGRAGAEAVLAISDSGPGIPAENRDKIFDLYFTTKEQGSGIGLAMTFRAVQLHGGSIDVESGPAAGATFRVRLPAALEEGLAL